MRIISNTGGIAATNAYLVADEIARQAVLFDAPDHTTAPLLDEAQRQGWDLIGLWLTHGHFDHIADHAAVTARFPNAKILIHPLDEPKLQLDQARMFMLPFDIPTRKADGHLHDGQTLQLGQYQFHVIHTPGHAPGHVMFHCPTENILIGGDLIIMNAVGRTDLPDSSESDLYNSIKRIMQLPGQTRLLPGHGEISTLDDERRNNLYVKTALRK